MLLSINKKVAKKWFLGYLPSFIPKISQKEVEKYETNNKRDSSQN